LETEKFIYHKLEAFIRKYYTNELIRGTVFFIGLGLLYLLCILFIEYFLWLRPIGRLVLFLIFITVEVGLLVRYILFPIFKLFKLQKGLSYDEASSMIGNHFADVNDILTNFLQLSADKRSSTESELLVASINQKAKGLQLVPFGNAIIYKRNIKYVPLAIIPILLICVFFLSGNSDIIAKSYNRIVHFNTAFSRPAPFRFVVLNDKLQTEQNKDFIIRVKTIGDVVPENVMIFIDKESYFLENAGAGVFQFRVANPTAVVSFHLEANKVVSKDYELLVVQVPTISDFEMVLDFPNYLGRKPEIIKGTGNAIIPEGTQVTWKVKTQAAQDVVWSSGYKKGHFSQANHKFIFSQIISQNTDYHIVTSNSSVLSHEKLNYQLIVVKDQFPTIEVNNLPDSLLVNKSYVVGQISDDYGISKLQIVYYVKSNEKKLKRATIPNKSGTVDQFLFSFPGNLAVEEGAIYEYYFEVFDDDIVHGFKSSKSSVFASRILTDSQKNDEILQQTSDNIQGLDKTLNKQNMQINELDKLQKLGREKDKFEFKDQQLVKDFINQQKKQDELMKQFADKIKQNMESSGDDKKDDKKEALLKRLENAEKELSENDKLLEELKELNEKIKNEELLEKVDKFKQNSKNQVKNLKQLVELTKKYYVEKKAAQIANKLDKLSEKLEQLSEAKDKNTAEKQDNVNREFDKIKEELKDLNIDNEKLAAPVELPNDDNKAKSIDTDLKSALDELSKNSKVNAKPKQKNAAKNMKALAGKISKSVDDSQEEQLKEDVKMLRQIVDNLVAFSLSQEDLMSQFKSASPGSSVINKKIKWQQDLKAQFKHVDDSLYTLSLRNAKIAEKVTREVGNMQYNIDKSLESFSDAQFSKGISYQQYTISSANKLGDFLSNYLSDMQMSLSGSSSGKPKPKPGDGDGMQLPDIIKKQDQLADKLKGEKDGSKGVGGGEGKSGKEGNDGEGNAKAILEIYKEQRMLRQALEDELRKQGLSGQGNNVLEQMKQLEKQLVNKGFSKQALQNAVNIKRDLLKLQTAIKEQGDDNKREAEGGKKQFSNRAVALPKAVIDYFNSVEILNRQSLPLRSDFNLKIQEYFKKK
jgi:hypothetical protein